MRLWPEMARRGAAFLRTRDISATASTRLAGAVLLASWLAGVLFTIANHEFWRDEVRVLSLARAATSPLDLYGLVQYDGHPVLWYLLLFAARSISDTPLILPVVSVLVALSAVALFLWRAPFPLWLKGLFVFGALPFYEYVVVARNYGISMLLLFVAAALYRERFSHPVRLAAVLALLANSNVHSAILATLIAGLWTWEVFRQRDTIAAGKRGAYAASLLIFVTGLALCAAFTVPKQNTVLIAQGLTPLRFFTGLFDVAMHPGDVFAALGPYGIPSWLTSVLLLGCIGGLAKYPRLVVTGLCAMLLLGGLFLVVYPGAYRHQGLLLVFLLFLYWIGAEYAADRVPRRGLSVAWSAGLHGAMAALMVAALVESRYVIRTDLRFPMSSSKALAEFLRDGAYRNAILVAEPDYFVEALPFYVPNRIYFPRERRFGTTVSWTTASKPALSLNELVAIARQLERTQRQPVLIILGHREVRRLAGGLKRFPYRKQFVWTQTGRDRLAESTRLVAEFASAVSEENYALYALLTEDERRTVVAAGSVTLSNPRSPNDSTTIRRRTDRSAASAYPRR